VQSGGAPTALVTWEGSANINPFYLRSAPYLLFSDSGHTGSQSAVGHRLARSAAATILTCRKSIIPSARPRVVLAFLPSNGGILAQVRGAQAHFQVKVRFGDRVPRTRPPESRS